MFVSLNKPLVSFISTTMMVPNFTKKNTHAQVCFAEYDHMFYDLDDPEMMYELDRRHRHWLKENGVIRQGVLWRKEELLQWFDR